MPSPIDATPESLRALGIFSIDELVKLATKRTSEYIVEGLIPTRSITALIGDWGVRHRC